MEARKITVVSTKTQKKSVIMSGAETLGELKRDLNEAGIDYTDMTFFEGTSRTELNMDDSVLPKDVPYTNRTTGETRNTNELVFMLTNTNKKIKSGAMSRAEVYGIIRDKGLQAECKATFGKNFTQCSTNELITLVQRAETAAVEVQPTKVKIPLPPIEEVSDVKARAAIVVLVNILHDKDIITNCSKEDVLGIFNGTVVAPTVSEEYKPSSASSYSDNEIDAMFRGMC